MIDDWINEATQLRLLDLASTNFWHDRVIDEKAIHVRPKWIDTTKEEGQSHQEVALHNNSASINFSSMFTYILLFLLLFPRQQNRKNVVCGKTLLVLSLTGCFDQKWHWWARPWAEKLK